MIKLDKFRAIELQRLAYLRFGDGLESAERKILVVSASSDTFPMQNVSGPHACVRAEFLRWLATDPECAPHIDALGIRVYGATLQNGLNLEECVVSRALDFRYCEFQAELNLKCAKTQGIHLFSATLAKGIEADSVEVLGSFLLRRTDSHGEVCLVCAQIRGALDCSGSHLIASGNAFMADGVKVGGDLLFGVHEDPVLRRFESNGKVSLVGAEISGQINASGAKLSAEEVAFEASGVTVGDVFLRTDSTPDFESFGDVRFVGANINGDLDCSGAKLRKHSRYAFTADRAAIKGDVFFRDGFEAEGKISLWGAQIGSYLDFSLARVGEVDCSNMILAGDLRWLGIFSPSDAYLDLSGARLRNLHDEKKSWPSEGRAVFDGLIYDEVTLHEELSTKELKKRLYEGPEIRELSLSANERIEWLKRQLESRRLEAQPWMFLAKHLEAKGDRHGAKHVIYAFRCLQLDNGRPFLRWLKKGFVWLEEDPIRILGSIAVTLLIGTSVFIWGGNKGAMTEAVRFQPASVYSFLDERAGERPSTVWSGDQSKRVSPLYPKFQPFVYTLENSVPLVKLGMDEKWVPSAAPEFCWPWFPRIQFLYFVSTYGILNFTRWFLIIWGWVQATILAAAVADRFKN